MTADVENGIFWSETGSGFGEPDRKPHKEFPREPHTGNKFVSRNRLLTFSFSDISISVFDNEYILLLAS